MEQNISQKTSPNETRMKIIETAMAEFAKHGLAGARVDRIAEMAGVNKAMIYYHFNSKEKLYFDIISEHAAQIANELSTKISEEQSVEEVITTMIRTHANVFRQTPYLRSLILRELAESESEIIKRIAEIISSSGVPEVLYQKLSDGIVQKKLRPINVRQAMVSLITMNIGFLLMSPLMKQILNITDLDQFIEERPAAIVDLFLKGVHA